MKNTPSCADPGSEGADGGFGSATPLHAAMRRRLLARAGLSDVPSRRLNVKDLERSEWSPEFEQLMRNRPIMGAMRYGKLRAANKPQYNRLRGARKRLAQYEQSGNLEALVDVANMMLLEFVEGRHPKAHFRQMHDDHCCL